MKLGELQRLSKYSNDSSTETCEVKEVEVIINEDADDDDGGVEADLNEALELLGECQIHFGEFIKRGNFATPTLQLEEIKSLSADINCFLDQWTFPGEDDSNDDMMKGVIDV